MTTIAYRDGVLAADTGMIAGDSRIGHIIKIVRGPTGNLGGAAGTAGYCEAFKKWVLGGEVEEPPVPKSTERYLDRGVVFHSDGRIDVHEDVGRFQVTSPYYAFGSGRAEALGAMFAGADAATAVCAAIQHEGGTYGDVTVLRHTEEKFKVVSTGL